MAFEQLFDFQNIFSLEGKVAVVIGGTKGIGLAAASGMLQAGASKIYITSRTASSCDEACAKLNQLPTKRPGAQAVSIVADPSSVAGIQQLVDTVSKTTDRVDILLANAGTAHGQSIDTTDEDKFSEVLDVNLKGVFFAVQKFLPLLTAHATAASPSRVIVTASVAGLGLAAIGASAAFSYAASKAGVIHLVKQLAVDLGPRHILSNSIAPGFIPTELSAPIIEHMGGEQALVKGRPNGRLGTGEDFAAAVVFLASRAAAHVNGHCLVVDGGAMIGKTSPPAE